MKRWVILSISFCVVLTLAGCSGDLGTPDEIEKHPVGLNPGPQPQSGDFNYTGNISLSGIGEGCVKNLSVSLYDGGADQIKSKFVGELCYNDNAPQSKNFTINSTVQPIYIIIESPDFWDGNRAAGPTGYVRRPNWTFYEGYPIQEQAQVKPRGEYASTVQNRDNSSTNGYQDRRACLEVRDHAA